MPAFEEDGRWLAFGKHYIRDIVYAANDGIITTFAVVAGVRGAELGVLVVLALGFANLIADGLSMAVGDYLGIKSERAMELGHRFEPWDETVHAAKHGVVTWFAFILAGMVPLLPFVFLSGNPERAFWASLAVTGVVQFMVGALRAPITNRPVIRSGAEMLLVGAMAGGAAFGTGRLIEILVSG